MRPPLTLWFLIALAGIVCLWPSSARAQQQESKMLERLDREADDAQHGKGKAFGGNNKDFLGLKGFGSKGYNAKSAYVKDMYSPKRFNVKDFMAGTYRGSRNFWIGDFKFATKDAPSKPFATKEMASNRARESTKNYAAATFAAKPYVRKGPLDKMDLTKSSPTSEGWQGSMAPMTIDQVRDLLNKNK